MSRNLRLWDLLEKELRDSRIKLIRKCKVIIRFKSLGWKMCKKNPKLNRNKGMAEDNER